MRGGVHGNGARGVWESLWYAANSLTNTEKTSLAQLVDYSGQA
jgi:hypothetical protein